MIVYLLVRFGRSRFPGAYRFACWVWNSRWLARLQWVNAVLRYGPGGPARMRAAYKAYLEDLDRRGLPRARSLP